MFFHKAYSITVQSEVPLPELRPGGPDADVTIRFGHVPVPARVMAEGTDRWIGGTAQDLTIWWDFLGGVRIREGREVIIDRLPGVDDRALRTILYGSVMGVLLLQRSPHVFHASVVDLPGGAVAFLAHKGWGKSTMASFLHARGHDLVSDDLAVLDDADGVLTVQPGFDEIKLWPDAVEALNERPDELERVNPLVEKRSLPLGGRFVDAPRPLRAVYVLQVGPEIAIERLRPKEALFEVMPHWYGAQFQGELLPLLHLGDHLLAARRLVDRVPVYRLVRPADLGLLPLVAERVERAAEEAMATMAFGG